MSTLLLRLAAPLQSWGLESKFDTRNTQREPTKSGVLGLLAAACGIRRDDTSALKEMTRLHFGVRVDQEGQMLRDFHMAHGTKDYVTYRYYLSDAVFLCGLESDDRCLLETYAEQLQHPAYPLFLGRRSCPPTLPLVLGIRDCDLETALREEKRLTEHTEDSVRIVLDADNCDPDAAISKDFPQSFSSRRREFGYRKYREMFIAGEKQTEHDAFAEVEAENVSDAHDA